MFMIPGVHKKVLHPYKKCCRVSQKVVPRRGCPKKTSVSEKLNEARQVSLNFCRLQLIYIVKLYTVTSGNSVISMLSISRMIERLLSLVLSRLQTVHY